MNTNIVSMIVMPLVAVIFTGCAKEPPKCSDANTISLVREIVVDQLGKRDGITDKELQDNIKVNFPRASAYDEKIKRYRCEGKLSAAGTYEMPISYESQLDDNDRHIVSVAGISKLDQIQLQVAIANGIQEGRKRATNGATPPPQSTPAKPSPSNITGKWIGPLEGDGEMQIKPTLTGFDVALSVSVPSRCTGSIESSAPLVNDVLTITKNEDNQVCTVKITFSGDTAEVEESNCSYYHGAMCGFSGQLHLQK